MMLGEFNRKGELIFDIALIAANETLLPVKALFDTGFNEWLLINNKDADNLEWSVQDSRIVQTAAGMTVFNVYEGIVLMDDEEWIVPVFGGYRVKEILLGVR